MSAALGIGLMAIGAYFLFGKKDKKKKEKKPKTSPPPPEPEPELIPPESDAETTDNSSQDEGSTEE